MKWKFPSRNYGDLEGYANPGLQWFKDDPLKALAREVCQNSLDAIDDEEKPVSIVFMRSQEDTDSFPGISELENILQLCKKYACNVKDDRAQEFIAKAVKALRANKIEVLRISDFNTVGLQGAFDTESITPWTSLVKSTAVSIKSDRKGSAGSYGIGKAAAFVNSVFQTVFYRTQDIDGVIAAQGVAKLMAFSDDSVQGEDPVRRSTGYYGDEQNNMPVQCIPQLDQIYERTETGTDLFIPGFQTEVSGNLYWTDHMVAEILENFLMSIYNGRLRVTIAGDEISKESLSRIIARQKSKNGKGIKNAYCFSRVLFSNKDKIADERKEFHGLGSLHLRILYASEMNQKILVVRKSGMKIADISSLPKGLSYTGILELEGEELNSFFRAMENPQHNKWEPSRHNDPLLAREYKNEVESWVRDMIGSKLAEMAGDETEVDVGDVFNTTIKTGEDTPEPGNQEKEEKLLDITKSVDVSITPTKHTSNKSQGGSGKVKLSGVITDDGIVTGHRHRSGKNGGSPTGRKGVIDQDGQDNVFGGLVETDVRARVISKGEGENRLIFTSSADLANVEVEIVSMGENGKAMPLKINSISNKTYASVSNGRIRLSDIKAEEKVIVDFRVDGKQEYALGVKFYGN